ncbi:hypothetical protein BG006_009274 [Podila minutissima]|uniref:DUF4604 domain-containing protein n=1 Tax=Podila minutissima TaxID=64525 RepID=A0A9P5SHC8_9FUNG|nr:hypothetical protein BG006_009274 [Podila minutissima]
MSKKVTPHQMRKNLTYVQQGPDFMRMLTGQSATSAKNPYKKPIGIEAKFQGEEEDDEDETAHDILNEREEERPTVVVLKDGKHLDERQVKNILKNLPAGLSEAEIKRRLAEEMAGGSNSADQETPQEESSSSEDDEADYADGKIRYRKPKGSKPKKNANSTSNKKSFEETMLAEAEAKMKALKRKAGDVVSEEKDKDKGGSKSKGDSSVKKKKPKTKAISSSLLSFGDEE